MQRKTTQPGLFSNSQKRHHDKTGLKEKIVALFANNLQQDDTNKVYKDILKNYHEKSYYKRIHLILTSLQRDKLYLTPGVCNTFLTWLAHVHDLGLIKRIYSIMIEHSVYDFYTFSTVIKSMQDNATEEAAFAESVFTQAVKVERVNNFTINNFLGVIKLSGQPDLSKVQRLLTYAEKKKCLDPLLYPMAIRIAVFCGQYEQATTWLNAAKDRQDQHGEDLLGARGLGMVFSTMSKDMSGREHLIQMEWATDLFNKNYLKLTETIPFVEYLCLQRKYGNLKLEEVQNIYSYLKAKDILDQAVCCEVLIHASHSPQVVNEEWILSIFEEGLSFVINENQNYLYNAVISALAAQPIVNINLIVDLFLQGVVNKKQDLRDSSETLIPILLNNKCISITKDILEKFITCYEQQENEWLLGMLSSLFSAYFDNRIDNIDYGFAVKILTERIKFERNFVYNKLMSFATCVGGLPVESAIKIFKFLQKHQMADHFSYATILDVIYLTDAMPESQKGEWAEELYATAKENNCLNNVVIATYIKCLYKTNKHDAAIHAFLESVNSHDQYIFEAIAQIISLESRTNSQIEAVKKILDEHNINYLTIQESNILLNKMKRITRGRVGKWEDVLQLYKQAKQEKRANAFLCNEILFYLAERDLCEFEQAHALYNEFKNNGTHDIASQYLWGKILLKFNKISDARALLNELKPETIPIYYLNQHCLIDLHAKSTFNVFYLQAYFTLLDFIRNQLTVSAPMTVKICYGKGSHTRFNDVQQHPMKEVTFRVFNAFPKANIQVQSVDEDSVKIQIMPRLVPILGASPPVTATPVLYDYNTPKI